MATTTTTTTAATRPPWLCRERELEAFIEAHNPSLCISALRRSRNDCNLVGALLDQIVSAKNLAPCDWEMNLARIHLAVDLQQILKRWCVVGLQKTLDDGSALGILFAFEDCTTTTAAAAAAVEEEEEEEEDEVASPQTVVSPGWLKNRVVVAVQPHKRPLEDGGHYDGPVKMARLDEAAAAAAAAAADHYEESAKAARTEFRCPYYTQNPLTHPECAGKRFPNPRKLKEHVWRFIKPFKCKTCGEGFGREKTRVIHSQHRKTKCMPAPSTYENSPEHRRDRAIEAAKSTSEMIRIFQDYELEKVSSRSHDADADSSSSEYRGSSSPESDSSDSLDDGGSDGGLDSAAREYIPEACPTTTMHDSNNNTHYQQQQQQNPDDHSRPRRVSLTPDTYLLRCQSAFEQNPFHRGKSAPPNFSTAAAAAAAAAPSASDFPQPELPTIVVTEPQQIVTLDHSRILDWDTTTTQFEDPVQYQQQQQQQQEEVSDIWHASQRGGAQGHTGAFYSNGFQTFPGFTYNMNL